MLQSCTCQSYAALLCVRSLDQVLQSNVQGRLLRSNVSPFRRNETINFGRLIRNYAWFRLYQYLFYKVLMSSGFEIEILNVPPLRTNRTWINWNFLKNIFSLLLEKTKYLLLFIHMKVEQMMIYRFKKVKNAFLQSYTGKRFNSSRDF